MKKHICFLCLALNALSPARAALYTTGYVDGSGTSLGQTITDGQYPMGVTSTLNVSGAGGLMTDVNVTLNISGGWNGDLYGYLIYNDSLVVLLNRVGTGAGDPFQQGAGFSTAGFNNVTLDDDAALLIHAVENPTTGSSYRADGGSLASFNNMDPNGIWTLFLADNSGGFQSTLEGWSLDITAVPETATVALAVFGVVFVGVGLARGYARSKAVELDKPSET